MQQAADEAHLQHDLWAWNCMLKRACSAVQLADAGMRPGVHCHALHALTDAPMCFLSESHTYSCYGAISATQPVPITGLVWTISYPRRHDKTPCARLDRLNMMIQTHMLIVTLQILD